MSTNPNWNTDLMSPSDHEEADTRLFNLVNHAVIHGHKTAFIRTVDTDIVVEAISVFQILNDRGLDELWIGVGRGNHRKDIPIHIVASNLGVPKSRALPFVYLFGGSDFTAQFRGVGKKIAYNTWEEMPEMTETFISLIENPEGFSIDSDEMKNLEKYVVRCFSKTLNASSVNEARKILFTESYRGLEDIPPTKNALFQKAKRTMLISSFVWKRCLENNLNMPSPSDWGWEWHSRLKIWVPYWTDLPDASKGCTLLMNCGCVKGCIRNCKCCKMGIRCGSTCKCKGSCMNNEG